MSMLSFIHPTAVIHENVVIGEDVYIGPYCIIGFPPEDKRFFPDAPFSVEIKSGAVITGHVTIDAGTVRNTIIGENAFVMKSAYIAHDVILEKDVILSAHVLLGGHVLVCQGANLGMGAIVHPRQKIGAYAMLGMGAIVHIKARVTPGSIAVGNPVRISGENIIGLKRNNITPQIKLELIKNFAQLFE